MENKKKLVFIFDEQVNDKIFENIGNLNNIIFICKNSDIQKKIRKKGFNSKQISEYHSNLDSNDKILNWIKEWPDRIINNNKNFKDYFIYNEISIFWFLESRLYHYRIQELIQTIEIIYEILKKENPDKIWVIGNSDVEYIISKLQSKKLEKLNSKIELNSSTNYKNYEGLLSSKLVLLKLLRGLKTKKKETKSQKEKILVITEVNNWRKEFDFLSKQFVMKDIQFQNIIKKLHEKSQNVLIIDFENNPKRVLNSFSINKQRSKSIGCEIIPWEKYLTLNIILNAKREHNANLKNLNKIKKLEKFKENLTYERIPLFSILQNDIESLFKSMKAFTSIALIDVAKKILEIEKPSVIVMHDEYGALQLSIIKVAKKLGIPTISLQHGMIHEGVFAYTHLENHIKNKNKNLIFPLPDKMCVWSENSKNSLTKSGCFPDSIPIITGDPKLDYLNKQINIFDDDKIFEKYKIKNSKNIILFITENLPVKEKIEVAKLVLSNPEIKSNFLIIKPHPNEKDLSIYYQLISEYGLKNYMIITSSDLYELIHISKLVILSFSTVGIEAMRMNKPVISINLMRLHSNSLIIKKKMSLEVTNSEDLTKTIKRVFEKPFTKEFVNERKNFAENELGIIDGNAVSRIVQEIINLKNKHNDI